MKRPIIWTGIALAAGLLLGYLIFAPAPAGVEATHDHPADGAQTVQWTCSMHPQILQPEPGKCPICGMDLIPAEAGDAALSPEQFRLSPNALALADIRTVRVGGGSAEDDRTLRLSGTVTVNTQAVSVQASYFDGRIEQLLVNYTGQNIGRGQALATIYSPGLVAAQQELLTALPMKQTQPDLYQAVRKKLSNWKLTEPQIDAIEASGQVRENFPILATVSGTVTEVLTAEGDYVMAGQPLARLSNLGTVWAEFDAYERQIAQLRIGQEVLIQSNAYPGREFRARINFIDPSLDARTRTVTVRATLDNSNGLFKPGMFLSGQIQLGPAAAAGELTIPASAVLWTGERSLVYIRAVPDQPVFEMREVHLGLRTGEQYVVLDGLQGGEEVVAQGAFTVDAAAQLQGKKSMMNPGGGPSSTGHEGHTGMPMGATQPSGKGGLTTAGFDGLMPFYLELKDALVASDAGKAGLAAEKAVAFLDKQPETGSLKDLREGFRNLAGFKDLPAQREVFGQVSELLIGSGQGLEHHGSTLYVQFCPMANNNRGASWISQQEEVRNPYFGEAMMACGETRATWKAN